MKLACMGGAAFLVAVACGGTAVIDGGSGGSGNNNDNPLCDTPDPVGSVFECSTGASVGSGAPSQCTSAVCDDDGNVWESVCENTGCVCRFNGTVRCSCTVQGAEVCSGGADSCCPSPFPP